MITHAYKRPVVKRYQPVGLDRFDPTGNCRPGELVRVTASWGSFRGIVSLDGERRGSCGKGSLVPAKGVPASFSVRPLGPNDPAADRVTCGTCGLSWDDAIVTDYTPAPSARCPFEYWHRELRTRRPRSSRV